MSKKSLLFLIVVGALGVGNVEAVKGKPHNDYEDQRARLRGLKFLESTIDSKKLSSKAFRRVKSLKESCGENREELKEKRKNIEREVFRPMRGESALPSIVDSTHPHDGLKISQETLWIKELKALYLKWAGLDSTINHLKRSHF